MSESKPREWMIERNACAPGIHVATQEKVNLTEQQKPHVVHVIEKCAYDELMAETMKLRKACEHNELDRAVAIFDQFFMKGIK